jgi:hypothetical protein
MSPPEVWGPAVWTLFHTLIEKMNPYAYPHVIDSMFGIIVRICKVLPCPECSADASIFLAKIKLNDYKTKDDFKNMLYLFHNWVNAKKRKPLYNYSDLKRYSGLNLILVINNFIAKYNTKGNIKLLAESFQRGFVIKDLNAWFKTCARAFIQPTIINYPTQINQEQPIIEEPTIEENVINEEEHVVEEENVINEHENVIEENVINEEEYVVEEENSENITIIDEIQSDETSNLMVINYFKIL